MHGTLNITRGLSIMVVKEEDGQVTGVTEVADSSSS